MNALTMNYVTVCLATLASAVVGWVTPPSQTSVNVGEVSVLAGGFALGWVLNHDPAVALGLGTLFPGVYYAFNGSQGMGAPPKKAFVSAFTGAMFFLLMTNQGWGYERWVYIARAALLGFGGPFVARWLTEQTHRAVGLALIVAATALQVSRVPLLLEPGAGARMSAPDDAPPSYFTTAQD